MTVPPGPTIGDIAVERGNDLRLIVRLAVRATPEASPVAIDLTGAELRLTIAPPGKPPIVKTLALVAGDPTRAILALTRGETRSLPEGRVTDFELELRRAPDGERTIWRGRIEANGGINSDV